MTLAKKKKIIIIIEASICKGISIEYWGKIKKKRNCLTILIPKQNKCIKKISKAAENGKYMNFQYNSEQMFIICSNKD